MSGLLEYLLANPEIMSYIFSGVTAVISYFFVAKNKRQKKEILEKAFDELGLHSEALDLLTGSIEQSGVNSVFVKDKITTDKKGISPAAEIILHNSIDTSTGAKNRPANEKEVQDEFKAWASKLLKKSK